MNYHVNCANFVSACLEQAGMISNGQHVVMYAGIKNGRPQFIGSNNVNSDGSQLISLTSMNYPIMSIHQYRG